jgi:hypothetical protein
MPEFQRRRGKNNLPQTPKNHLTNLTESSAARRSLPEFQRRWDSKNSRQTSAPEFVKFVKPIGGPFAEKICTCPRPIGPAGCGPQYPGCSSCGYIWYCQTCGGCRQCAAPGRKVRQPHDCCEKSPFQPNDLTNHLLSRLQSGSHWLTAQHQAWLEGKPDAANDERFSVALAAWTEMERSLRQVFGYEGCICGPDQRCPEDAPVTCNFCMEMEGAP